MRPICRWIIFGQDTHLEGTLMSRTVRCEEYVPMKNSVQCWRRVRHRMGPPWPCVQTGLARTVHVISIETNTAFSRSFSAACLGGHIPTAVRTCWIAKLARSFLS